MFRGLHGSLIGSIHGQGEVRSPAMIIADVSRENAAKVFLVKHDHVVQTLPPNAPDETLRIGILPRTLRGRDHLFRAQAHHALLKELAVDSIAISEELPGR